jgi:hypothetical protein
MSRGVDRPVHVSPARPTDGVDHRADSGCRCEPIRCRDMESPARAVFLHRPVAGDATGGGERVGGYVADREGTMP